MLKRSVLIFTILAVVGIGLWYAFFNSTKNIQNIPEITNIKDQSENDLGKSNEDYPKLSVVAKNLQIPWALVFLPNGEILMTERPGKVSMIKEGDIKLVAQIPQVKHIGEGGLLGIEISPDFENDKYVYLYYTYDEQNGSTKNRVARYTFDGTSFTSPQTIIDNIPGAANHNGGRIKFGPDGFLYITTGDAQDPSLAQSTAQTAGKVLKVTKDGKAAPNNPFGNLVYSYGHRNPQGIAWDDKGNLWETEHGRSGIQSGLDELNRVEAGKNYGWDIIQGDETQEGMQTPVLHSGANTTWAPSGMAYYNGSLYFAGLRGTSLYQYEISSKKLTTHLKGELGRLREVVLGPDNMLYISTSNRDGRGNPASDDDRIIRVNPAKL